MGLGVFAIEDISAGTVPELSPWSVRLLLYVRRFICVYIRAIIFQG